MKGLFVLVAELVEATTLNIGVTSRYKFAIANSREVIACIKQRSRLRPY
jgi:hypothetical protein